MASNYVENLPNDLAIGWAPKPGQSAVRVHGDGKSQSMGKRGKHYCMYTLYGSDGQYHARVHGEYTAGRPINPAEHTVSFATEPTTEQVISELKKSCGVKE